VVWLTIEKQVVLIAFDGWDSADRKVVPRSGAPEVNAIRFCVTEVFEDVADSMVMYFRGAGTVLGGTYGGKG